MPWEAIVLKMLHRSATGFETAPDFAVGIVLTVPPFPYTQGYEEISKGIPVILDEGLSIGDRAAIAFVEVELRQGALITSGTSGTSGYVGVATGCAATVETARVRALERKVYVPKMRYRNDIGVRVSDEHIGLLQQWGCL